MATAAVHGPNPTPHHFSQGTQSRAELDDEERRTQEVIRRLRNQGIWAEPKTLVWEKQDQFGRTYRRETTNMVTPRHEHGCDPKTITPVDRTVEKIFGLNSRHYDPQYEKQIDFSQFVAARRQGLMSLGDDLDVKKNKAGDYVVGANSAILKKSGHLDINDDKMVYLFGMVLKDYKATDIDLSLIDYFPELDFLLKIILVDKIDLNSIKINKNLEAQEIDLLANIIINFDEQRKNFSVISNNEQVYCSLGDSLRKKAVSQLAIVYFTKALQLSPKSENLYKKRALAHFNLKNFEAAKKDFNEALKLNPNYYPAMLNLANLYCEEGDYEKAVFWLTKAHQIAPKDFDVNYNMALTFIDISQSPSCTNKQKAIETAKLYINVANNLAASAADKEDVKAAMSVLKN